jgi:translation elongation factor EF-Tu-like GTPase
MAKAKFERTKPHVNIGTAVSRSQRHTLSTRQTTVTTLTLTALVTLTTLRT